MRSEALKKSADRLEGLGNTLTTVSLVCGGAATLLTGGSAAGAAGTGAAGLFQGWRLAAMIAAVFSFAGTMATQFYKQWNVASRLAAAQTWIAKLELLEMKLEFGRLSVAAGLPEFERCVTETAWVRLPADGSQSKSPLKPIKASVDTPELHAEVGTDIACSGTVAALAKGTHLWLAVEGADGSIWPKESELSPESGRWAMTIRDEGTAIEFTISLFLADEAAHRDLVEWIGKTNVDGHWPARTRPAGTIRLASVRVRRAGSGNAP